MTTPPNDDPQPGEIVEYFPPGSVDPLRVTFHGFLDVNGTRYASVSREGEKQRGVLAKWISRQPDITKGER